MKAISCPQCGALIKEIAERQTVTVCDYCGANVLIAADKTFIAAPPKKDIPPNPNIRKSGENALWNSPFSDPTIYGEANKRKPPFISVPTAVGLLCAGFFIFIVVAVSVSSKKKPEPARLLAATPAPYAPPTPIFVPPVFPTPLPQIEEDGPVFNFSYRVSWDSAIPEQHIELPTLKDVDFPSNDLKTLRKTVFAQKIVRVKIRIDTNGEVVRATAVSGHQILRTAAETAALASYFAERRKPLDTTLVYHFQIKQSE